MQPISNATSLTADSLTAESAHDDLRELYAYPDDLTRPWIRANFVTSVDGGVTVAGTSSGLSTPADHAVFTMLRELADVIVVGAGTARAEDYGGAGVDAAGQRRRAAHGLAPQPPIAVVTAGATLDPASRLFTETEVAPVILAGAGAPRENVARLSDAGATVVELAAGSGSVAGIVAALGERGWRRVLCEGGPHLVGQLLAADAVDELCLTTSPVLVGGTAARPAVSPAAVRVPLTRALLLGMADGTVLTRWVRTRD